MEIPPVLLLLERKQHVGQQMPPVSKAYWNFTKPRTKKLWFFIGDSTMTRTYRGAKSSPFLKQKQKRFDQTNVKDVCEFYGTERDNTWQLPAPGQPVDLTPCNGPNCIQHLSPTVDIQQLWVIYAFDSVIQSPNALTTQEVVASYIQQSKKENEISICFVNSGMHDATIPSMSPLLFGRHVKRYLSVLTRACDQIVWVTISETLGDRKYKQSNILLYEMNVAVRDAIVQMHQDNPFRVMVLDVWEKYLHEKHANNAHMSNKYYAKLGSWIAGIM